MGLFVDTSVWSLALRRDAPDPGPEVAELRRSLKRNETLYMAGLVLQELLQGFSGPKAREQIIERLAALPLLVPDRCDHIDALLGQLCIRHVLTLLSADEDFRHIARATGLRLWDDTTGRAGP